MKYTLTISEYLQRECEVEVEADSPDEARSMAREAYGVAVNEGNVNEWQESFEVTVDDNDEDDDDDVE